MQGAEELYVLLLSPNKSSSYITFAEKKNSLRPSKNYKQDMETLPFLWKLRHLKNGQFRHPV